MKTYTLCISRVFYTRILNTPFVTASTWLIHPFFLHGLQKTIQWILWSKYFGLGISFFGTSFLELGKQDTGIEHVVIVVVPPGPVGPVSPTGPIGPGHPSGPAGPVAPVAPIGPEGPTIQIGSRIRHCCTR